ncbi:MAG TPA: glycosyltransferase family 39 protein [Verrucomicrobiae bacterium]
MSSKETNRSNSDLIGLAMILAISIALFELWMATTDHENSRSQHLGGAVMYAKGHIDLLRPMLLGFNANSAPTPLEFPIWAAVTAGLMKCFGLWHGWGNVVSLIFFYSSLVALFDLCRRLGSLRIAWWAVVFSLLQPLTIWVGGQAGADSASWSFAMWFIYFSYRMMNEGRWTWYLAAVVTGCLSATTKAPFFMTAGLATFFWLCARRRHSARAWFFLASAGMISFLALLAWNHHCSQLYLQAEFPTVDLNPARMNRWYFGSLAYRLNLHNWLRGFWHLSGVVFGSASFIVCLLLAARLKRTAQAWLWLLAAGCTTMMFTTLLWEHLQYFFIYAPAVAWLCAVAAAEFEFSLWDALRLSVPARALVLAVVFGVSLAQTYMAIHINMLFDNYEHQVAQLIKENSKPTDKILVWGMTWGDPFLDAERDGLTGSLQLDDTAWINDPAKLQRLQQLGFREIVLINPSPFIVALTSVNGKHGEKIVDLHARVPAVARNWPVIYDSTQLLIIRMPDRGG